MKKRIPLIAAVAVFLIASAAAIPSIVAPHDTPWTALAAAANQTNGASGIHAWTGVWQVKETNKPGVVITLADDSGALIGTIVFDIYKQQTNEHIGTEPRTVVNPHLEGNTLAFQVRRILKPQLKGDPPISEQAPDPTDIVDMTLVPTTENKATLNCPKCGANAPTELVKVE
ncbi:MAG TPA: hypothetical protein VHZ52_12330 [Acidobacteriaceae bacterium]|jgi:hypothetical protein|nr:hypothetical protein [Acidobacteriaceae bacterium]